MFTPVVSAKKISTQTVSDTITQGETDWYYEYISSSFKVELLWGNPSNILTLTIYSPDGAVYGPYYDSDDGRIDGKIALNIRNAVPGIWNLRIYGEDVDGVQSYIFMVVPE